MSDVLPLSGISGLSFDSRFLSPVLFFDSIRRHEAHDTLIDLLHGLCTTLMSTNCSTAFTQSTGSRCIIGGSCHKYNFCRDKSFVPTKIFCRDKHNFVATKLLSRQAYFCRDNTRYLWQAAILVASQVKSSQVKKFFIPSKENVGATVQLPLMVGWMRGLCVKRISEVSLK